MQGRVHDLLHLRAGQLRLAAAPRSILGLAPAPEPLAVVAPRAVDAQGRPVVVLERTQGGPATAPVKGAWGTPRA